jgi:hypothetical protein
MRPCLEKTLHKKGLVEWSRCSTQVQTAVLQTKKKKEERKKRKNAPANGTWRGDGIKIRFCSPSSFNLKIIEVVFKGQIELLIKIFEISK